MKIKHAVIAVTLILPSFSVHSVFAQSAAKKISPAETKKNQQADDVFLQALQTGDVSKLGDIAGANFINHGVGEKVGPDSLKSSIKMFHSKFKPKVEVISRTTDGVYFGNWVKFSGATPGVVIEGIEMTKYANGKALEHWFFPNNQGVQIN